MSPKVCWKEIRLFRVTETCTFSSLKIQTLALMFFKNTQVRFCNSLVFDVFSSWLAAIDFYNNKKITGCLKHLQKVVRCFLRRLNGLLQKHSVDGRNWQVRTVETTSPPSGRKWRRASRDGATDTENKGK